MSWRLKTFVANAYQGIWEDITDATKGLRIRAAVHGGVQFIQFEIGDDYRGAYRRAYDYIGCKIYVLDNSITPPVAEGVVYEPGISEEGNRVTAFGPWPAYMFNQVYNDPATWLAAGNTGAQVEDILTNECPDISTNYEYVDEPSTANWPWKPTDNAYPGDLIPFLASLSDASNNEWYFWLAPNRETFAGSPVAYFKSAPLYSYQAWREDMAPGGLQLIPSLRNLVNDARVMHRDWSGRQTQTASATDADSQARFWLRERWDFDLGKAPATAADQYRDLLLAKFKDPQQSASFRLNARLYDDYGGAWPLWRAIAEFPIKFTVVDLIPDATLSARTLDQKRTFVTVAAEYDYDNNILTIMPDTEDNRADAMLARYRGLQ